MIDRVGQQLGNYRLLRLLGQGGQASVYLGEHIYLGSQAAVKIRHTTLTQQEQTSFLQEAQILVRLSHPHIVRVLDFALQDGLPFLVMEYAPQGTLRHRHPRGTQLPLDVILPYVKEVASALQYTHDQRLIHRDVKPENLLLNSQDQVLLSDFGLVLYTPPSLSLNATEPMEPSLTGTVPYLSPEHLQGQAQPASDQYALAIVVYEWLCGTPPFHGSFLEVAVQQVLAPPPSIREQVPDLAPAIEEVVLRALRKEPEQRFASVEDFALALHEACRGVSALVPPLLDFSSPPSSEVWQARKRTLPVQPTPFIGREQEVATVHDMLLYKKVRLLTLTGPGGVGKTRLLLAVAQQLLPDFTAGVYFVPLAAINDPDFVLSTIAQVLNLREVGTRSLLEELKSALREQFLLLLLDNFEHVLAAAPQLADLLATCPHLHLLVTSRAPLRLQGEREFAVAPLALPDLNHLPARDELAQYAACMLFVQRVQAIKPDFQVTEANAGTIAEICIRLDGLPLAIELAAARIRLLSPQALLARLSRRLEVLTGGARNLPARQQTLRATIAWSYQLLAPAEQQLFRCLSIFAGSCTLQAVEAITKQTGAGAANVLDGLSVLLENNLVRQVEQPDGEPRLLLLHTIREFGLEYLERSGELEATQAAHAAYYLVLAEEATPQLRVPEQAGWVSQLEMEQENLRAALRYLLDQAHSQAGTQEGEREAECALRLCVALLPFWHTRGYGKEGLSFLMQALAESASVGKAIRARALNAAVNLAYNYAPNMPLEQLAAESLALSQELGDPTGIAASLLQLGTIARVRSQFVLVHVRLEEAAARFEELGDSWRQGQCYTEWARAATEQGQYEQAHRLLEKSLLLYQELGDQQRLAWVHNLQAYLLFVSDQDHALAQHLAEESLTNFREVGNILYSAEPLGLLGLIYMEHGELETARALLEGSRAIKMQFGIEIDVPDLVLGLARLLGMDGDVATARRLYHERLTLHFKCNVSKENIAASLEGLAALEVGQGESRHAARLWGAAEVLREAIGAPIYPVYRASYEQARAQAHATLGEQAFRTAWAQGRSMTPEQVLAAQEPVTIPTAGPPSVPQPSATMQTPTYPAGLTAREVEVLRLIAQGWTDAQIAEHLVISPRTVNRHTTSLYSKLNVSSRAAATRYAIEQHLL